jgi:enhancing lycopene biosynthesis protein 2
VNLVDTDHIDVTSSQLAAPEHDDMDIVGDDINEFSDDEESFILMTPAMMLSQQIASQTQ